MVVCGRFGRKIIKLCSWVKVHVILEWWMESWIECDDKCFWSKSQSLVWVCVGMILKAPCYDSLIVCGCLSGWFWLIGTQWNWIFSKWILFCEHVASQLKDPFEYGISLRIFYGSAFGFDCHIFEQWLKVLFEFRAIVIQHLSWFRKLASQKLSSNCDIATELLSSMT